MGFNSYQDVTIDMINIFEVFLPQLLRYPNVQDPLNAEAAHLMQRDSAAYEAKVRGKSTEQLSLLLIDHVSSGRLQNMSRALRLVIRSQAAPQKVYMTIGHQEESKRRRKITL